MCSGPALRCPSSGLVHLKTKTRLLLPLKDDCITSKSPNQGYKNNWLKHNNESR